MKIFALFLILCVTLSIALPAKSIRLEEHIHIHSTLSLNNAHDFDHTDLSKDEYSHRHSPSEPVHQHKTETGTMADILTLAPYHRSAQILPPLPENTVAPLYVRKLASLSISPPHRPPRG